MNNPLLLCLFSAIFCAAAPPGIVIDYSPASSRSYIGSPSIAILSNGHYVASHDLFGPGSGNRRTLVFGSEDRGRTWRKLAELDGQWWSTLFTNEGALYLLGTTTEYGNAVIRRSRDGGHTWTNPTNHATGLLRDDGQYHCAPMPVIAHEGRLWRAMERRDPPVGWGVNFRAGMISAPSASDLLQATNWTFSRFLQSDTNWLGGTFGGWLEGNALVTRAGQILDILRVDTAKCPEKAALANISPDGRTASFDPRGGFVDFPGGAKKFTIRYDPQTDRYWSLATVVPEHVQKSAPNRKPGSIRNTLALTCSADLTNWTVRCFLLHHPDIATHGFQYVDWLFEGADLIAVCRTAFDDDSGGAHNNHDANFLTFHRLQNFRRLTLSDSVPFPSGAPAIQNVSTETFTITGSGWSLQPLKDGGRAFANRDYVWEKVPLEFRNWSYTQTSGGEPAQITVEAKSDTAIYLACASAQFKTNLPGWTVLPQTTFHYTDRGRTEMSIGTRLLNAGSAGMPAGQIPPLKRGEEISLPSSGWTGALLLIPPTQPRPPKDEKDLRMWLENMFIFHRFTIEQAQAATGSTSNEISTMVQQLGLANRPFPARAPGQPLWVLPYPGGRHPRVGFLEGAVNPQRDTKVSVFTPWDEASYVVVDVPEAIFSNLGLTYLAHTHIPTIWDQQNIQLPPQEWVRRADGGLESQRVLPNQIAFGARISPTPTEVRMDLWLRNGTQQKLTGLRVQNCVMLKAAAGFAPLTLTNKVFKPPYAAAAAANGRRWIITAWDPCDRCWGNDKVPCLHADPKFPDCAPGETQQLRGWLSFYEGSELEGELQRIEQTGWRQRK